MENQSAQVWCNSWLINYLDSFRFEWKYFLPLQGKYCKKGSYGALQPHTQYLDQKLSHSNLSCLLYVASNVCAYTFGITNGVISLLNWNNFMNLHFYETFFMKHSCCNFANMSEITRENADHFKNTPLEKDSTHSCKVHVHAIFVCFMTCSMMAVTTNQKYWKTNL